MKAKRVVAGLLAIVLVCAFSMTAFAWSSACPRCGTYCPYETGTYTRYARVDYCPHYNGVHSHLLSTPYVVTKCPKCGTFTRDGNTTPTCPYE